MFKIWGIFSPYKSGVQKPPFLTTLQLNGNFNGLYLRNKTWYMYRQQGKCVDNYKGSPTPSPNDIYFALEMSALKDLYSLYI